MKLGYINYLNCYPFYYYMFEKEAIPGVEIIPGYPEELNRMMLEHKLDISPISSAAYTKMQEHTFILPDFCLSSIGYVRSVVLYCKIPIEELDGRMVGLTSASQTSVVMLKILLKKYYNLNPEYKVVDPNPCMDDLDAVLVIGNEAMIEKNQPIQYVYDLGDLWMRKTGYPVVFAIFAVQKKTVENSVEMLKKIIESYKNSLNELKVNEAGLVEMASKKYPDIKYDVSHYYKLLKFEFTKELKSALNFYYSEAASLGLLKKVDEVKYYKI